MQDLEHRLGRSTRILKFADPLYEIHHEVYRIAGLPEPERDRKLLQWIGTDWGRAIDPEVWIKAFRSRALNSFREVDSVFVTDCRFQNEALVLRELGFSIVRVSRPGLEVSDHVSEHFAKEFRGEDFHIENDSTLDAFRLKVQEVHARLAPEGRHG